jgi:peptidoglycan/LPS O-acetylase OafA/YrhL
MQSSGLPPMQRYHDFDALRAVAMLLGIVLHGMMSLVPLPVAVWPAQDVARNEFYLFLLHAIHGFRLQLFFVLSGFFTMMMWKKYGLKKLLGHRTKRILLPLLVFTIPLLPIFIATDSYGRQISANYDSSLSIWDAAKAGDADAINQHIASGADPNAADLTGVTPLNWATRLGHIPAVKALRSQGVDIHTAEPDGTTALHNAALFGNLEMVKFLVTAGANVNAETSLGYAPLSLTEVDELSTLIIAEMMSVQLDDTKLADNRAGVVDYLEERGANFGSPDLEEPLAWLYPFLPGIKPLVNQLPPAAQTGMELAVIFWILCVLPVFQHLWFLYYLFLIVLGFVAVTWICRNRGWKPVPSWMVSWPLCLTWVVPLAIVPQFFMITDFGPDTAASPIPWPPLLLYYSVFFGFGALSFGRKSFDSTAGRFWPIALIAALPILLLGQAEYSARGSLYVSAQAASLSTFLGHHLLCTLFSVLYAWLMIFGLIGAFRKYCSGENPRIRYLSDASYWLYIAHLPVAMLLQIWIANAPWPGAVKLLAICTITTLFLLVIYELAVRYTWIGAMLNGRKSRNN